MTRRRFVAAFKNALPPVLHQKMRSGMIRFLHPLGFLFREDIGPVDFRGLNLAPEDVMARAAGLPSLTDIPLDRLRNIGPAWGFPYFPCQKSAGNPYIETILEYLREESSGYANSPLAEYYKTFKPTTIAEVFGLDDRNLHPLLFEPPLLAFPPWVRAPLDDYGFHLKWRERFIDKESRMHGQKLTHKDGWAGFGPVSSAKGEFEVERLISVTQSISGNGYRPVTGAEAVKVNVLRFDGQYAFLCVQGHHRTSALAALGYASVPAMPQGAIVDRDDVMGWPGVKASVFTPEQALQIFDMFFHGQPPKAAMRWWGELQSQRQSQLNTATH